MVLARKCSRERASTVRTELVLISLSLSNNLTEVGFGLGFNAGPVRVSASLRGAGGAAADALEALPFLVAVVVGYSVIGAIVSLVFDPYFWFIMVVGCGPAVALVVFHAVALDKAARGTRWSARDGIFTLLAVPSAGYELLLFAWAFDGFGWERSIGGKWMPQLAYFVVLLAYLALLTLWITFTVNKMRKSMTRAERRHLREIKSNMRRQASKDRRLMRENRIIVKQHGIKNATSLRRVLDDYRILEEHKDLALQHGFTDGSQVRAYLQEQVLEKSRIQQLEMERAKQLEMERARLAKEADEEARRRLRVLTVKMQQLGLVVQKCLNPEQGTEVTEEELRAAFRSIRSPLDRYREVSPTGVAKYEKIISELSASVQDKTGYQNL